MPTPVQRRTSRRALIALLAIVALPVGARAQGTAEQQEACTGDAVKLCASDIPNVAKITACMKAHVAQLNPRCRAAFNDATSTPAAPKPRVAARDNRRVVAEPAPPTRRPEARRPDVEPRRATVPPRAKVAVARPELPAPRRPTHRDDDDAPVAVLPQTPAASPEAVAPPPASRTPGVQGLRAQIVEDCREGLIDPFTCRNTLQALRSIE